MSCVPSEDVTLEQREAGPQEESGEAPEPDGPAESYEPTADVSGADESVARHWALLPDVCLQHVLRWLGDQERARASLVCRRWHRAARSPALWRRRRFCLTGRASKSRRQEQEVAVGYARSLGAFLEELEVLVVLPYRRMVTVARRLQLALRALFLELCGAGARLRSLSVRSLDLQQDVWTRGTRDAVVHCLTHFLGHMAARLLRLRLWGCRASLPHGLRILEVVSRAQQQHLACTGCPSGGMLALDLEGFFSADAAVHTHQSFPRLIGRFHRLERLTLSYSCVSDELLEALGSKVKGHGVSLKLLRLKCHYEEPHAQVVCGSAWYALVQSCPELCVEVDIEGVTNIDRLRRILLPGVPLSSFAMSECNFSEQDISPKPVFRDMLPRYWSRLQVLSVEIDNWFESVDRELLDLLMMCSHLHTLAVNAYLDISFVEQVLEYCQETRCPLRSFDVKVCYLSAGDSHEESEEERLEELMSFYSPFIHPELQLSVELFPIK
ncbi:F-box only protein 39-like [Sardina pilchardus]|uniref:F-box only protein 39-like n=1 Tax=Sardina pilchardus TaxID=27697 RepID=UPI002E1594E0